jgi:hypothetical protein
VTGPQGGLQLEMHDMTGDKIPNDLIIRPALLRWLPTIVVKDGKDHYAVAVSGTDPGSMSSGEELASRGSNDQGIFALICSGFKVCGLAKDGGLFPPQIHEDFSSPSIQTIAQDLGYSSSSGRAPPAFIITA